MLKTILIQLFFFSCINSFSQNLNLVTHLGLELQESSGLINLNGRLITLNDSGGESRLYEIDTISGGITRSVFIDNATNIDWEDLCFDENFIYIGDIGNNSGTRTNLKLYKVSIDDYLNTNTDTVTCEAIYFSYSDQVSFIPSIYITNYDAETLISKGDSLYIFTKNWGNNWTNIYPIPKIPGTYSVNKIDSIDVQGLITGGTFNHSDSSIMLCGYTFSNPFIVHLKNLNGLAFSSADITRNTLSMPNGNSIQIEGICPTNIYNNYFLSSEQHSSGSSSLMDLKLSTSSFAGNHFDKTIIYPNPTSNYVFVKGEQIEKLSILDLNGVKLLETELTNFDVSFLKPGSYQIVIFKNNHTLNETIKFLVISK